MNRLSKKMYSDSLCGQICRKVVLFFLLLSCATFSAGCKKNASDSGSEVKPENAAPATPSAQPHQQKSNLHKLYADTAAVWVEIADNDATRQQGLMWREAMPQNQGMLFVFPTTEKQSFWMHNTYLPLDIAFIDGNWTITDIHHMEPLIDTVYYNSSVPVPYALEVNRGWFAKHGVRVGDKVKLE